MISSSNKTQLGMEQLEDRAMPAATNYFVLDFTPDYHAGSFADTFRTVKTASGYAPNFLDFNGDRVVNNTDIQIAAQQVANRVAAFYGPFINNTANHLSVKYGDVLSNQNMGFNWIKWGISSPSVQVSVMYIGGTNSGGSGILGRAPLAGAGENIEGYGETYSRTIANSLLSNPRATPTDFVNKVANTAAHELGHMMGLRHSLGNASNIMNGYQSYTPGSSYFVNAWQNTTNGYQQQAYRELDASFQLNQRQIPAPNYSLGGRFQLEHDDDGCGDGHEDDHEALAGVTDGVRLAPEFGPAPKAQQHASDMKSPRSERFEHSHSRKADESQSAEFATAELNSAGLGEDAFEFGFSVSLK